MVYLPSSQEFLKGHETDFLFHGSKASMYSQPYLVDVVKTTVGELLNLDEKTDEEQWMAIGMKGDMPCHISELLKIF